MSEYQVNIRIFENTQDGSTDVTIYCTICRQAFTNKVGEPVPKDFRKDFALSSLMLEMRTHILEHEKENK